MPALWGYPVSASASFGWQAKRLVSSNKAPVDDVLEASAPHALERDAPPFTNGAAITGVEEPEKRPLRRVRLERRCRHHPLEIAPQHGALPYRVDASFRRRYALNAPRVTHREDRRTACALQRSPRQQESAGVGRQTHARENRRRH